jgi:hypothetical protein
MESDGSTHDTRIYTSLRRGGTLNPNPVGVAALLVFVCSVTGAVAPNYEVDWNEAMVSWWT